MKAGHSWSRSDIPDLAGKVAIVTGANSGIGFETARVLAARGAKVVVACRSPEKGKAAAQSLHDEFSEADARYAALDLADLSSVKAFAEEFGAQEEALHILCNNAGVMMCPRGKTSDGFETQFGTNHLGHFALTGRLMDALRATPGARVVTVSSLYHQKGHIDFENLNAERSYERVGAYAQSKLANLLFTLELQRRFEHAGLDVLSVAAHPGYTATNLQRTTPLFRLMNHFMAQSPPDGALPTLYAATAPDVRGSEYYGPSGWSEMWGAPKRVVASDRARDAPTAARLWDASTRLTAVDYGL